LARPRDRHLTADTCFILIGQSAPRHCAVDERRGDFEFFSGKEQTDGCWVYASSSFSSFFLSLIVDPSLFGIFMRLFV
jgi:hypothetical protein